jgi:hypothetical protein
LLLGRRVDIIARMAEKDPNHWLYRFDSREWLHAARHELAACIGALHLHEQKRAVAHARRAAGMALNGLLVEQPREKWGRSYIEHLHALPGDPDVPHEVGIAATELLAAPLDAPRLIHLGGASDLGVAQAATTILDWSEERLGRAR